MFHMMSTIIQGHSESLWDTLHSHQCDWALQGWGNCGCVSGSESTAHSEAKQRVHSGRRLNTVLICWEYCVWITMYASSYMLNKNVYSHYWPCHLEYRMFLIDDALHWSCSFFSQEQYHFIFDLTLLFLDTFSIYSNFKWIYYTLVQFTVRHLINLHNCNVRNYYG